MCSVVLVYAGIFTYPWIHLGHSVGSVLVDIEHDHIPGAYGSWKPQGMGERWWNPAWFFDGFRSISEEKLDVGHGQRHHFPIGCNKNHQGVSESRFSQPIGQWHEMPGWWFGTFKLFFHILGMSSQLTNSYSSEGWLNHKPEMLCHTDPSIFAKKGLTWLAWVNILSTGLTFLKRIGSVIPKDEDSCAILLVNFACLSFFAVHIYNLHRRWQNFRWGPARVLTSHPPFLALVVMTHRQVQKSQGKHDAVERRCQASPEIGIAGVLVGSPQEFEVNPPKDLAYL